MIVKQLENLKETADHALAGLEATPQLRRRIEEAALGGGRTRVRRSAMRPALAFAMAAVVLAMVAVPQLLHRGSDTVPVIVEQAAGTATERQGEAKLISRGQVSVTSTGSMGEGSLWAGEANGSFPLVGIHGRYYRLMTYGLPAQVRPGTMLGTVEMVTEEPVYASGVVSNHLPTGTALYAVEGMDGAVVTAESSGVKQVYQRVSVSQMGLAAGESLDATLCAAGRIASMTLSGVGTVSDPEACARLYAMLSGAVPEGTGPFSGQQTLHITLTNSLVLEMAVRGDRLSACGVWNCPGFSDAFAAEIR